jgi:hypothetical protein
MYPSVTMRIDDRGNNHWETNGFTFREAGRYRVRVAYHVQAIYRKLWQPPGGAVYSNQVVIDIREPTSEEKEILDAYWSSPDMGMGGDNELYVKANEPALEAVIAKYPPSRIRAHAEFALARSILRDSGWRSVDVRQRSLGLLADVQEGYPDFRYPERQMTIGFIYGMIGAFAKADSVFGETLRESPELIDDPGFIYRMFQAEEGAGDGLLDRWERDRARGKKWDAIKPEYRPGAVSE